jgi:hypothetical protein
MAVSTEAIIAIVSTVISAISIPPAILIWDHIRKKWTPATPANPTAQRWPNAMPNSNSYIEMQSSFPTRTSAPIDPNAQPFNRPYNYYAPTSLRYHPPIPGYYMPTPSSFATGYGPQWTQQ